MEDETEKRRELLDRIYSETLPGIAKEYRRIPDFLVRKVLSMYLAKEEKQDALVRMFFSSKVFKSLSHEDKELLSGVTGDDILASMEGFSELPKVSIIYKILSENRDVFCAAVERGCRKMNWDE
jgi:hypothetical protein